MKKICILQNSMVYGGTDTFVINLCRGLVKDHYDVTVVLSTDPARTEIREQELADTGVHIIKTCSLQKGLSGKIKHLVSLYSILRRGKFDAFQTNIDLFNGPQMFIAWLAGVPIRECHSHNAAQGRELRQGRTWDVRLYQAVMRWLCRTFSNRKAGCSEAAMDFLFPHRWREDSKSCVVHNGIDLDAFRHPIDTQKKKESIRAFNRYNICTIGRIDFQKNPEFIVEIFSTLAQLRPDVDLLWCGTGVQEDAIRQKAKDLRLENRIHFLGARKDAAEILKCSDVFLLPSRFEGLGIVVVEAQAAGLPCVISNAVPREADCGGCIALSLEEPAQDWAMTICNILDGKRILKTDSKRLEAFSIQNMVKEMEEVLSE